MLLRLMLSPVKVLLEDLLDDLDPLDDEADVDELSDVRLRAVLELLLLELLTSLTTRYVVILPSSNVVAIR